MKLQPADPGPMTRRESAVRRFVRAHYGLRGTLALHRHALGADILRAPVNVTLAPVFLLARLGAAVLRRLRLPRAADWLSRRQIFLKSAMTRRIEADLAAFADDLRQQGLIADAPPEAVARAVTSYAETRNAVAEITTSAVVLLSGLLLLHRATPGVFSLAGPVAELRAQAQAIEGFALGNWAGRLWYGAFPTQLSTLDLVVTGVVLTVLASLLTTFAGLVADPLQLWSGVHRRRLMRLLARLDRAEATPTLEREHVLARAGDLSDAALSLWRSFRG